MRCLVIGSTGYIGARVVPALTEAGHQVRCLARDPSKLAAGPPPAGVEVVAGDVTDGTSIDAAFDDVDVVYYLVHSLTQRDFRAVDRAAAHAVARAAADAGAGRVVYLGGLRPGPGQEPSAHLASRAEVGDIFLNGPVPAAVLQAGVITGSGSTSFEVLRHLTDRLPVMLTPRWVGHRTQPIAVADVLGYLVACADLAPEVNRTFDIGGPDQLTYLDMIQRYARVAGLPRRLAFAVPLADPGLSATFVSLLTPVSRELARPLIESLNHDLICGEHDIAEHVPEAADGLLTFEQSLRRALSPPAGDGRRGDPALSRPTDAYGDDGYAYRQHRRVDTAATPESLWRVIEGIGGDHGWYTVPLVFELRGALDHLLGGIGAHRGRRDPQNLRAGDVLDFWRVEAVEHRRRLRLRAQMRMPGTAWLDLQVVPATGGGAALRQDVTFRPTGLAGHLYWWAQRPAHDVVFAAMAYGIVRAARAPERRAPACASP